MTQHIADDRLQDWLDARLDAEEAGRVEAHVASCDACAREAAALRTLIGELRDLPRALAPRRDLHAGIAARIGARPATGESWLRRAALIALLAAGGVAVALSLRSTPPATGGATTFERTHAEYARAVAQLEDAVRARQDALEPETAAALDRSLAAIDAAIDEAGAALARDPGSPLLNELVLVGYEQKLGMLRRAADPSSP